MDSHGRAMDAEDATARGAGRPVRAVMLLDGGEQYGLPTVVANTLEAHDRARVHTTGLFIGPGPGFNMLAPHFDEVVRFGDEALSPLRRPDGPYIDPVYQFGKLRVYLNAWRRLAQYVRAHPVDVIHTHGYRLAVLAARGIARAPVRHVLHVHGETWFTGGRLRRYSRFVRRRIDRIATISQYVADALPPELRDMATVVYNGANLERLRADAEPGAFRQKFSVPADAPLIGIFGSVVPIKGHRFFVDAARIVADAEPAVRFAVVGGTTKAFERAGFYDGVKQQIIDAGLSDRFILTDFIPDATRYMTDFTTISMPSAVRPLRAGEGFGMVMLEAMAQGVPVVATRCGAAPEVIEDGVTGLLAAPNDGASLAAAMLKLLRDPSLRARIGAAGMRRADRFSAAAVARRLEDLYEELTFGRSRLHSADQAVPEARA